MPEGKYKISAEDKALFRREMRRVIPLRDNRVHFRGYRPKPHPVHTRRNEKQVLRDMMSDSFSPEEIETGEELVFSRPGLQKRVLRRLRQGAYSVNAELDLHGKTVAEARIALAEFLRYCRSHHMHCVRIVHGKGHGSRQRKPVLKNKVNSWLQQRHEVLAYCSARPVDGGTGAVYVLLRHR